MKIWNSSHWIAIACLTLIAGTAVGQENEAVAPLPPTHAVENGLAADSANPAVPAIDAEKKKRASAGMAAIGGIAILGIGVIAFTMIWARRLRRLARDPGPVQTTLGNDFWFLKSPKVVAADRKVDGEPATPPPETTE